MPFEISILAAFGAMFFWGVGDFFIQRSTRKIGDTESLAFIGIIGALGLLPFVLPELPLFFTVQNIILLSFIGVVGFVVAMINFEALKEGKLSVIDVILEIELPITAMLGFMFFRESVSLILIAIISIIFIGTVLISVDSFSLKRNSKKIEKGILLALLTAAGMAVVNFLTAYGSKEISPLMVIWLPWVVIAVISLFFIGRREGFKRLFHNGLRFKRLILVMGIIDTLAWLSYAVALAENELAITTAITESYPAIAIFLGVWLNREKILPHQYAGAALALIASVSLVFLV